MDNNSINLSISKESLLCGVSNNRETPSNQTQPLIDSVAHIANSNMNSSHADEASSGNKRKFSDTGLTDKADISISKLTTRHREIQKLKNISNSWIGNATTDYQKERRIWAQKVFLDYIDKEDKTMLDLGGLRVDSLPDVFHLSLFGELLALNLIDNKLTLLPDSIGNLTALKSLNLIHNKLTLLPDSIGNLKSLTHLHLGINKLTSLPDSIGNLTSLIGLYLGINELTSLPDSIGKLTGLKNLIVIENELTSLPDSIGKLTGLKDLSLKSNKLTTLPSEIGSLSSLQGLRLEDNTNLTNLPDSILNLPNTCKVDLCKVGLSDQDLTRLENETQAANYSGPRFVFRELDQ